MFLCRSLPPLVDLPVPANRHRTRLCKTCTKPAKPLDLSLPKSETYSGIGRRQSHFSYPQCFQDLSPSKGAFFRKELIACAQPVPAAKRVELGQAKNRSEASWNVPCFERDACPISRSSIERSYPGRQGRRTRRARTSPKQGGCFAGVAKRTG